MRISWWYLVIAFLVGTIAGAITISLIPSNYCSFVVMGTVIIVAITGIFFLANRFKLN